MKKIYLFVFNILLLSIAAHTQVVINEVYGGGGNNFATYKNDFIELYNNGSSPVSLAGWTVQYASSSGTSWQKTLLSGTIAAHGYYLVQEAQGAGGTTALPTPDATGTIAMSATAGKVALVNNSTTLTISCPKGVVVDFVGFGGANCFEGTGPTGTLSNTASAQRTPAGTDTGNNNADFTVGDPSPTNGGPDVTPPTITALYPANNATNIMSAFTASLQFSENITSGSGTITVKKFTDNTAVQVMDVSSPSVSISGNTVSFDLSSLSFNTKYYVEVSNGGFKDIAGNLFAGISGSSAWSFTTMASAPAGTVGNLYSFNSCAANLVDGFSQFSVTGAQKWSCTTFGRTTNGVEMNGYANKINNTNEDWLISPSFDLSATNYPLLSFWSRTAFSGSPLQLKVSTDYSGTGSPYAATWTDLNGKFPGQISDVWQLSENINLFAFKQSKVYIAFVYTSTTDDGARCTMDDFMIANSVTPPPTSLTISTAEMRFPYVAKGSMAVKTFTVIGNDLVGDMSLSTSGVFQLSKDGSSFSTSITYTAAEANNLAKTVYVRFTPAKDNLNFTGTVSVTTTGANESIDLSGTSIDLSTTLEVVNWNLDWFGGSLGPADDNQQEANALAIMKNINADIYGLAEIVDESRLQDMVSKMPGYAYVISNYGSHTNIKESSPTPLGEAQKLAFVYKTNIFSNISTTALLSVEINTAADIANPDYENWASGRFPFMLNADVTLNCVTKNVKFVLVHAKANTSPLATAYNRRKNGADDLHTLLNTTYAKDNIIVLGDFNDDLDKSITTGYTTTSWSAFTEDTQNFSALTLPLSLAGKKSTASYSDVIDHVVISSELEPFNMSSTTSILSDVAGLVSNYSKTTTDHYPVFTRYMFPNTTAPSIVSCTPSVTLCKTPGNSYTLPAFSALDDCKDAIEYSYVISGATTGGGITNDASGIFNVGTSSITWTATDSWGNSVTCTTVVVINNLPAVSIPDAYAMSSGVVPNTVYTGYAPASSITLQAIVGAGMAPYTYEWSDGQAVVPGGTTAVVHPNVPTTYTVSVTNVYGCSSSDSKYIDVMDVSAGKLGNKVLVCHKANAQSNSLEVANEAIPAHIAHGDYLGSCTPSGIAAKVKKSAFAADPVKKAFSVLTYPNPSTDHFTLQVEGGDATAQITLKILDISGRILEQRDNLPANCLISIGTEYKPGVYVAEITQGAERAILKLIKQ